MKYENGKDIFPERLLKQIQKYVSGKLVYIPANEKKRIWGESSGYKQYLMERNRDIKMKFNEGVGIEQLADEFYLSVESIKIQWSTNAHCHQQNISQNITGLKNGSILICSRMDITRIFLMD